MHALPLGKQAKLCNDVIKRKSKPDRSLDPHIYYTEAFLARFSHQKDGSQVASDIGMKHPGLACSSKVLLQGDLLLLACGKYAVVNKALDRVRQYLGKELNLIDEKQNAMLWITDFPMYEYNEDEDRLEVKHSFIVNI